MAESYESIALWAKDCAMQVRAGVGLPRAIETAGCFSGKKRSQLARELAQRESLGEAFRILSPSLSWADIAYLDASKRAGSLDKGFEVLSDQYFTKARVESELFSAFTYPIGIVCIGWLLINVQAVLYGEALALEAARQFGLALLVGFAGLCLLKKMIRMRPPLLGVFARALPPFRGLTRLLAFQRSVSVLQESSIAAVPVVDMFQSAADAGGASRRIAERFRREVLLGAGFEQSFKAFLKAYPKCARSGLAVGSPNDLASWSQQMQVQLNMRILKRTEAIRAISKPVALVICSPALFIVLQELWITMGRELSERLAQ